MKKEVADFLIEADEVLGDRGAELYEGYSGRGMHGTTTYGVTCTNELKLMAIAARYAYEVATLEGGWIGEAIDVIFDGLDRLQCDSMGRGVILY